VFIAAEKVNDDRKAIRYDAGTITGNAVRTKEGYLKAPGTICLSGILTYQKPDGSVVREYRPDSENERLLHTLRSREVPLPVTIEHPPGYMVNAQNTKELMVGFGSDYSFASPRLDGWLTYYDAKAIEAIERAQQRELSLGYYLIPKHEPGIYRGERYDCIQTFIDPNHLATTERARAGCEARLHLDSRLDGDNSFLRDWDMGWRIDSDILENPNRRFFFMGNENSELIGLTPYSLQLANGDRTEIHLRSDSVAILSQVLQAKDASLDALRTELDSERTTRSDSEVKSEEWQEALSDLQLRLDQADAAMSQVGIIWDGVSYAVEAGSAFEQYLDASGYERFDSEGNPLEGEKNGRDNHKSNQTRGDAMQTKKKKTDYEYEDGEFDDELEGEGEEEGEEGGESTTIKKKGKAKHRSDSFDSVTPADLMATYRAFPHMAEELSRFDSKFPTQAELDDIAKRGAIAILESVLPSESFHYDSLSADGAASIYAWLHAANTAGVVHLDSQEEEGGEGDLDSASASSRSDSTHRPPSKHARQFDSVLNAIGGKSQAKEAREDGVVDRIATLSPSINEAWKNSTPSVWSSVAR
jgi:hypothetical protein